MTGNHIILLALSSVAVLVPSWASAESVNSADPIAQAREDAEAGRFRAVKAAYGAVPSSDSTRQLRCEQQMARLQLGEWDDVRLDRSIGIDRWEPPDGPCEYLLRGRLMAQSGNDLQASAAFRLGREALGVQAPDALPFWTQRSPEERRVMARVPPSLTTAFIDGERANLGFRQMPMPSLPYLCQMMASDIDAEWRIIRRATAGSLQAAVIEVESGTNHRMFELYAALREGRQWRVLGRLDSVGVGHGESSDHELRSFAFRQVIPGGPLELDARIRANVGWMGPCFVRAQPVMRRAVCALSDRGEWGCHSWDVSAATSTSHLIGGADPACRSESPPHELHAWGVDVRFTPTHVNVREGHGELPEEVAERLGSREIPEVFSFEESP